jgi:hypothetical protein
MTLTVEDGTGKADADTYCSTEAADAHHAARGITNWATLLQEEKEQALRRATDYMTSVYGPLWSGLRANTAQALDWPRTGAPRPEVFLGYWLPTEIPPALVKGCAELALRAAAGELLGDQGREVVEQTVGPITTKYAAGSLQAKRYAAVDALLANLMTVPKGSGMMRLVRA